MRVKLQLVISHDDGHEETVTDIITLNKNNQRIEHLGLSLAESKVSLRRPCLTSDQHDKAVIAGTRAFALSAWVPHPTDVGMPAFAPSRLCSCSSSSPL